jgi:hypothetical protein
MRYIYFLLFYIVNGEKIIRNMNINACKDCIYFKPSLFADGLGKCEKFGTKNIVSNKITYEYADLCRLDEEKCGETGKYFEPENEINKMIKYNIFLHSPYGLLMLLTFASTLVNIIK